MDLQETFDIGVTGVIAQGFVCKDRYVNVSREMVTNEPCRCLLGHSDPAPVGTWTSEDALRANNRMDACHSGVLRRAMTHNDSSVDLADFRDRMSRLALENGLDDSCCWWEVAS